MRLGAEQTLSALKVRSGSSGRGGTQQMFTRGGSVSRSNLLTFNIPFFVFAKIGTPFVYLLLTNSNPFTHLVQNFASLLTDQPQIQKDVSTFCIESHEIYLLSGGGGGGSGTHYRGCNFQFYVTQISHLSASPPHRLFVMAVFTLPSDG